jgi:hypothetical protein
VCCVCLYECPLPVLCVRPPQRFGLSISYGYDAEYYIKLAKQHDFDVLNIEIHKLNDIMTMTLNEADYQKVCARCGLCCAVLLCCWSRSC